MEIRNDTNYSSSKGNEYIVRANRPKNVGTTNKSLINNNNNTYNNNNNNNRIRQTNL